MSEAVRAALNTIVEGGTLSLDEARLAMGAVMDGEATPAQLAALLMGLRMRGETVDELAGFASAMRERSVRVTAPEGAIDVVGTGGDGSGTFNISTAAALVAAAAGAAVAKHGNRSASSSCGSADVLEELGVELEQSPGRIAESIDTLGFGFMFARAHHPAMRHAAPVRQELGLRTVFNVLGPLANPAGARDGVFGVFSAALARTYAEALLDLGARHAFVVHGAGGIDELSPAGPNLVVEVRAGSIAEWSLDPRDVGLAADRGELAGGAAPENAAAIRSILAGEPGGRRSAVVLNAALALVAAGVAGDVAAGATEAAAAIDSGAAAQRLDAIVAFSRDGA
jgi:anthranilate phosphoribosyltransferase